MTKLNEIKFYNEGSLFEGLTDYQIMQGRRIRKMFKALTKGGKMNKNDAINKIINDVLPNMNNDSEITEKYIKAVLE